MGSRKRISFQLLYWIGLGGLAGGVLVNLAGKFLAGVEPHPSRLYIGFAVLFLCIVFYFADRYQQKKAAARD